MILYPRGHKFRCPQGEAGHVYEENNLCIKEKRMVDSSFSNCGPSRPWTTTNDKIRGMENRREFTKRSGMGWRWAGAGVHERYSW